MAAHRAFTTHPLVLRRVTVRRVREVSPRMRRVTLGGDQLAPFTRDGVDHPGFAAPGFDDHVKLVLASDGDVRAALPAQLPHGIEWTPAENRLTRDYTPRRVDAGAGELDLDFVVHGDGPAAAWAASARVGDELWFVGPKSSLRLPERLDWILLIGDETALPAIGRFLDERPLDAPAHVLVTVPDDTARQELASRDGDTVTWVVAEPGDAAALEAAVRALPVPAGDGYAWAAAESRALLPVRRHLRRERKLPKDRLNITGYWHREETSAGEAGEAGAAGGPPGEAAAREQGGGPVPSPLPWLVARAALQLGVIDAVADAPGLSLGALASRVGVPAAGVGVLLPPLTAHGVLVGDEHGLRLGAAGEELLDDHEREEYVGQGAELLLALAGFAPALRVGVSPWQHEHEHASHRTLYDTVTQDAERYGELVEECEQLAFLLDGLAADPLWEGVGTCLLTGPGSAFVVAALDDAGRRPRLRVAEGGVPAAALRGSVRAAERIDWSAGPADVAVAAKALAYRTDDEAAGLLTELAGHTSTAILVEASRPDGLSPRAAEAALHAYAATGSPLRDSAAIAALAERTGWRVDHVIALGWGTEATVLRRP